MSVRERRRLVDRGVRVPERSAALAAEGYVCPALDGAGRCGVHEVRPMVCRLWGAMTACPARTAARWRATG
jgi:Fe-S-cluster containining protein